MEDLKTLLQAEFEKIHNKMDSRFNEVNARLDHIEHELEDVKHQLEDVKKVVRESAEDILENQVEMVATNRLHENKISMLEANVLDLKKRVRRLEKVNNE